MAKIPVKCTCGRPSKVHKCPNTNEVCKCCDDCTRNFCEWLDTEHRMEKIHGDLEK